MIIYRKRCSKLQKSLDGVFFQSIHHGNGNGTRCVLWLMTRGPLQDSPMKRVGNASWYIFTRNK